jgi:dihydroorotase
MSGLPDSQWTVAKDNLLLYKCERSPLKAPLLLPSSTTFVNGKLVYDHGEFHEDTFGMAIDNKEISELPDFVRKIS